MHTNLFISSVGDEHIYSSPDVYKPETRPGALERQVHEDARGRIERFENKGVKYNVLFTNKEWMRSGDLHKNTQFDLVLSGKVELWSLQNDRSTQKTIVFPNTLVILRPNVPHLFHFLEDTLMIEWWDGPFEAWFYKPYREIIDQQL